MKKRLLCTLVATLSATLSLAAETATATPVQPALASVETQADKPMLKGAEIGTWTMDIPAALALAKETQTPVLVNFTGSDWCGFCKMMDKLVFSKPAWKAWAKDNLVLIWVDFPRDKKLVTPEIEAQNQAYAEKFGVQGFPSYFVLNPDGERIGRLGSDRNATPELFIERMKQILILLRLDELLPAEDLETYAKLEAANKDLACRLDAWQLGVRAQSAVFQKEQNDISLQVEALKAKAIAIAEGRTPEEEVAPEEDDK